MTSDSARRPALIFREKPPGGLSAGNRRRLTTPNARTIFCRRATEGYPEVALQIVPPLLQSYAKDFCAEGDKFRAGDALNFAIGQGDTAVTHCR